MTEMVYLVEAKNGLIKIGFSNNPEGRVITINSHSAIPVRLIAYWPGSRREENSLHKRFGASRTHCEWFALTPDLSAFVDERRGLGVKRVIDWHEAEYSGKLERNARGRERQRAAMIEFWQRPETRQNYQHVRKMNAVRKRIEAEHPDWDWRQVLDASMAEAGQ